MSEPSSTLLVRLERLGRAAENAVIVLLLSTMIIMAVGQIALREIFNTGVIWSDEFVRLVVLWTAMFGAIAASRDDRHLRIDLLTHLLSNRTVSVARLIVEVFAAVICGIVAWQASRWLKIEFEYRDTVLIDFPAWLAHAILPLAFVLMSYRFSLSSLKRALGLLPSRRHSERS